MPQLPEDIIDQINAMKRRLHVLSRAVHNRPALNRISGGAVEIVNGGSLTVRASDGQPVFQVSDAGLARPWLALLAPQDVRTTTWPQTASAVWTTVSQSVNPIWQPRMRLQLSTRASSGATGQVRVLIDGVQWGPVVAAGQTFDHTGAVATSLPAAFGTTMKVEVQGQVTSATGTVYAQTLAVYGTQN